jgi:hypothetical protein
MHLPWPLFRWNSDYESWSLMGAAEGKVSLVVLELRKLPPCYTVHRPDPAMIG